VAISAFDMSISDQCAYAMSVLTDHAETLNAIRSTGWWPKVVYDIMSGALIWTDESNDELPFEVVGAMRCVFAYRTSLMLEKPREEFRPVWELGLEMFPKWIGFRLDRRQPTQELLQIYRRGDVSLRKCLRDLERQSDKENAANKDTGNAT